MTAQALVERVADVAEDALDEFAPGSATRERVARVLARLDEPLRVAVAGREKAGKSTFVNALLGENVAPTDAGVCTRVVTWYRHDTGASVEVTYRSGNVRPGPLRRDAEGQALIDLGAEPTDVERVTIYLPNAALTDLTIIDTPGLSSIAEEDSASTRELLFVDHASRAASEKADALVFMLLPTVMTDDRKALVDFTDRFGGLAGSAGNALAILGRADQIGDGTGEQWEIAETMAARQAEALAGLVSTVTPLVGLLAESAAHLRARDTQNLVALAALDGATRGSVLTYPELLLSVDSAVSVQDRQRLIALLGRFGLARLLEAVDEGLTSPRQLIERMRALSGIALVQDIITRTFRQRSDALRARAAMVELSSIAWEPDAPNRAALRRLRDELERLELDPAMHRLAEIGAGQAVASHLSELPAALRADVHHLLSETDPAARLGRPATASVRTLLRVAAEGERRWRALENDPTMSTSVRQIAKVFTRSHALLYDALASRSRRAAS